MKPFRRSRRAVALAAWFVGAAVSVPAPAQVRAVQVTSDNDAYDFWIPMVVRPDYEYSNGVRVAVETEGSRGWTRLAAAVAPCARPGADPAERDSEAGCASTTWEAGQRLYTPRQDSYEPLPGQRPFAGWLYAAVTGRVVNGAVRHTFAAEAGVTGDPSLGRSVMEAYHRAAGFWNPVGWRHQLAFEPALGVRYAMDRRLAEARVAGVRVADLTARAGAGTGTLRTGAHAGVRMRAGARLPHAWVARPGRALSAYVLADAGAEAVAHDLFLDGSLFAADARVTREPLVANTTWGVGVQGAGVGVEFRVQHRSRAYREEPGGHPYGSIEVTWRQ